MAIPSVIYSPDSSRVISGWEASAGVVLDADVVHYIVRAKQISILPETRD